jgi:hypothetical protein
MKYRTTIEVVTEAENKKEAMEVVDDYLTGNLISGVDMRCTTRPVHAYSKGVISVAIVSIILVVGALSFVRIDTATKTISYSPGSSTVQPPLKTTSKDIASADFKKEWEKKHTTEALEKIKKTD